MANHKMQMSGVQITWLGHATFKITSPQGKIILIDPWTQGNPACPDQHKNIDHVDIMLVSHGHFDHVGDAISIATATKPTCVAIVELAGWLESKGVQNTIGMNKGGTVDVQGIKISMTHAIHTSSVNDSVYVGESCGFVVEFENGVKMYHAGDTNVFGDMAIIRELYAPEIVMLPMGDLFTMGPREAAYAINLLKPKTVIPMHFGTFPVLTGTPAELKKLAPDVEVLEMKPGVTIGG